LILFALYIDGGLCLTRESLNDGGYIIALHVYVTEVLNPRRWEDNSKARNVAGYAFQQIGGIGLEPEKDVYPMQALRPLWAPGSFAWNP
jgi:hypothetical protein